MTQVIDLTAKLLATENLTVMKQAVETAYFDVERRELVLPIFKDMTHEIEQMLVCHEVGHALYTNIELVDASSDNDRLHTYINVVEDVRIEKLMKRKYPGIKKVMTEGYRQLNDRDFFGVKDIKHPADLLLIDRMNLWFKVGISSGVSFSEVEHQFIVRAEKTETPSEVIQLAKDIYEFSKDQMQNKKQKAGYRKVLVNSDDQGDASDEPRQVSGKASNNPTDASTETENASGGSSDGASDVSDSDLESITDVAYSDRLDSAVDTTASRRRYIKLDTNYDEDTVVGYKQNLQNLAHIKTNDYMTNEWGTVLMDESGRYTSIVSEYNKFKTNTTNTVNYLLKEFEMKKAATDYKRTQVSKTGSLDMKKIWGYQLNDDLFKRISITKDGKNHGMQILVDWSGSMRRVISDVMQQVITLAMFCQRAQIPYQVLAFTDSYYYMGSAYRNRQYNRLRDEREHGTNRNMLDNAISQCALLELFSHKMSNKDFNDMSKILFNTYGVINTAHYGLGGTPLNHALAYMLDYTGKFINMNNVEKMTFITLTDGQGSCLRTLDLSWDERNLRPWVIDPKTKIAYEFSEHNSTMQTDAMLNMLTARYDIANIGFYIANSNSVKELSTAFRENGIKSNDYYELYAFAEEAQKEIRRNGFTSIATKSRDTVFVVPTKSMKIEDVEIEVKSDQTSKAIAKKFTKVMEGRQLNRVLLNQFISYIS